jgi:hypothetical protein
MLRLLYLVRATAGTRYLHEPVSVTGESLLQKVPHAYRERKSHWWLLKQALWEQPNIPRAAALLAAVQYRATKPFQARPLH